MESNKHIREVVTIDDGALNAFPSEDNDAELDNCDCDSLSDFPCWPCVRTGRTELPNEPPLQQHDVLYPGK
ncbi:hypothetical protein V5735_19445 [Haladaptatus sp. SPP-AMP-3]|uniref:hypothetical protein n=1 Tax=Haladaptatus sp. SPP-AMP-3 TaxID=3121295 RepID=UPI003C2E3036